MQRDYKLYIEDILTSIEKIQAYTERLSYKGFIENELLVDGVVKNLEIIGEAVKHLPTELKKTHSQIDWRKIAGLRDILVHHYFGLDREVIWDIMRNKLPELKLVIEKIQNE